MALAFDHFDHSFGGLLPVGEALGHDAHVVLGQVSWLNPIDVNDFVNLIDCSLDQAERHRLHQQVFNVADLHQAVFCDE